METYNYDAAAVPEGDADTTPAAAPETDAAAAGTSDTAQSGFSSQPPVILTYPDSSSNDLQVSPGFGPYGDVMPSLPSNNHGSPNTGGCINCGGSNWKPSPNGALWTWGILSPFFSTSSEIAHLRFYNAASIRQPIDVYRRTNPGFAIVNTNIRLRSGYSYTLAVLGTFNDFSVQMLNA